jgi:hypothetical protein
MSKTIAKIFIVVFACINIGIGVYVYKTHKNPKPTPPKPVVEQTQPTPAPEPELPRVPARWIVPEVLVSGEIVAGEAQDEDCIDNYLVIKKIDGTQVIVNDIDWSTWKAVEVGDFIN